MVENLQVTQVNQSQVIKVKSVQSFRGIYRTKLKILGFARWIAEKAPLQMFDRVLNTHTSEIDVKDTRTIPLT